MSSLFQIGVGGSAGGACQGLEPLVRILKNGVMKYVCILIPIALMLFGIIDLGKAVIASDEKEVKAAQGRLIKRCIYAALIFFVVYLVQAIMDIVATGGVDNTDGWKACWEAAAK